MPSIDRDQLIAEMNRIHGRAMELLSDRIGVTLARDRMASKGDAS